MGKILDDNQGVGHGFDFLRLALSLGVVGFHAAQIAAGDVRFGPGILWLLNYSILIMFFGLSGFLISASALRLNLKNFLLNRGLRIFPALVVEVLLSAFVLGPIFTVLPLSEYFTDHKFFYYFINLIGGAYYLLPGVFGGQWVNGSIWTVPYEIGCYAVMSFFIITGCLKKRWIVVAVSAAILAIELYLVVTGYSGQPIISHTAKEALRMLPANMVDYLFYDRGSKLLVSFTVGIAFYLYRHKIPYSKALFALSIAVMVIAEFVFHWESEINPLANLFLVVPGIYVTIFLGISKIPTPAIFRRGDYSYGIYLYGFPFTQATREIFPEASKNWVFLLIACMVPTVIFAASSWHLIERPILQLRRKFSFVARQRLADAETDTAKSPRPDTIPARATE